MLVQEGYAAKYNTNNDDQAAVDGDEGKPEDPMQGLEGLAEAGPRLQ